MKLQTTAKLRRLRISPRKVRLIADLVRGMDTKKALLQLQFSKKHAARPVEKLIRSAIANAIHNHSMVEDSLVVKTIMVDGGPTFHRWMPRAFGRATPLRKRTSHITLVLEGDVDEKALKKAEAEKKKEKSKAENNNESEKVENKEEDSEKKQASVPKRHNIDTGKHSKPNTASKKQTQAIRKGNK